MSESYNIGIDLGTSNCTVSVFANGRVRTIPIDNGKKVMPAYVYIGDKSISVGKMAELKQKTEPSRVIYGMKRMMGRLYDDKEFQSDLPFYPFEIEKTETNGIILKITDKDRTQSFSPIQMQAFIISQAITCASEYLKGPIGEAVITVPAFFNNVQRNDMINAGLVAGLEQVHLFSEPTAAAISYGLINTSEKEMVLVVDFGAGTIDVSIIQISAKVYTVMSCSGDSHLGGEDITQALLNDVINAYTANYNKDPRTSYVDYMILRNAVEEGKKALSSIDEYEIDEQIMGDEFHYTMTRITLENMNRDLFNKCLTMIDDALTKAYLHSENITRVLLVGGSCNIPYIRDRIIDKFGKQCVSSSINAVEAISQGAAVIAGISRDVIEKGFNFQVAMYTTTHNFGNDKTKMSKLIVNDITPMNIGISLSSGKMSIIIPASSSIPCQMRKQYQAHRKNQQKMKFKIYQGLDDDAKNNKLISQIVVSIDNPGSVEDSIVEVAFSLDSNSTLYVEAIELRTMKTVSQVLDMGSQVLPRESVFEMKSVLHKLVTKAHVNEKAMLERNKMTKMINQAQSYLESLSSGSDVDRKMQTLVQYREWITTNEDASAEDYIQQRELLNELIYDD